MTWQPIETAPLNERVLLYDPTRTWTPAFIGQAYERYGASNIQWYNSEAGYLIHPTHWMPLPKPPKGE